MTCDDLMPGEPSRGLVVTPEEMETIKLDLPVIVQRERRIADSFQSFVRPRLNRPITPSCRQLMTIEQCEVDSASGFIDAMQRLNCFASGYAGAAWLSWGKYDATQIRRDGTINQTSSLLESIPRFHVKDWFEQVFGEQPGGLKPTVERLGLAWARTYRSRDRCCEERGSGIASISRPASCLNQSIGLGPFRNCSHKVMHSQASSRTSNDLPLLSTR